MLQRCRWCDVDDAEELPGVVLEQQLPGAQVRQRRLQLQHRLHLLLLLFSVHGTLPPRPLQSGMMLGPSENPFGESLRRIPSENPWEDPLGEFGEVVDESLCAGSLQAEAYHAHAAALHSANQQAAHHHHAHHHHAHHHHAHLTHAQAADPWSHYSLTSQVNDVRWPVPTALPIPLEFHRIRSNVGNAADSPLISWC